MMRAAFFQTFSWWIYGFFQKMCKSFFIIKVTTKKKRQWTSSRRQSNRRQILLPYKENLFKSFNFPIKKLTYLKWKTNLVYSNKIIGNQIDENILQGLFMSYSHKEEQCGSNLKIHYLRVHFSFKVRRLVHHNIL